MSDEPKILSGSIVALRLVDVAYSIDLARVEALWAQRAATAASRSRFTATPPKAVAFDVPPVVLALEAVVLELDGREASVEVLARVYDFGVITLALCVPVADLSWSEFVQRMNAVDRATGAVADGEIWESLLTKLRLVLEPALTRPTPARTQEDYLLGTVNRLSEPLSAADLQARIDLVPLLSGERAALSEGAQRDLLKHRYSYYTDDLVALTWDRAFIYEPRGDSDVDDVLEVANAQLLELRYYDELLDDELPRIYELVERTRRRVYFPRPGRYAKLARRLYALVAEVTELTEKVDNALQVTEDVYLARVYAAALELFRVRAVAAAVDRKLAIIRDTYTALYEETSASRAELLEITIVVLIVFEIFLALIRY